MVNMAEENHTDPSEKKGIEMNYCILEFDGTVTCNVSEKKAEEIQKKKIRPRRLIFEIDD